MVECQNGLFPMVSADISSTAVISDFFWNGNWGILCGISPPHLLCFDDRAQSKVIVCCQALNRLVMVFKFLHLSELEGFLFATTPTHLWVTVVRL